MENNLALLTTAKEVGNTIASLATTFRALHIVKKGDMLTLKEKVLTLQRQARAKGLGELSRTTIEEISQTQKLIEQKKLSGSALEYAMRCMEQLSEMLIQNIKEYENGHF